MKKEMVLPKLRPEMEKAVVCAYLKNEGDSFCAGEVIYEVETDKVVNQIEATENGRVVSLCVDEGDEVKVGEKVLIYEN